MIAAIFLYKMKNYISKSLYDTEKIAKAWLGDLSKQKTKIPEATVVGLAGHLGAGKTAFSKLVAKELLIQEEITSPTFVIMKIYSLDSGTKTQEYQFKWHRLIHIDAYRLERMEDLEALRWEALVADPFNLILMEWPENVGLKEFAKNCFLKFEIKDGDYHIGIR